MIGFRTCTEYGARVLYKELGLIKLVRSVSGAYRSLRLIRVSRDIEAVDLFCSVKIIVECV